MTHLTAFRLELRCTNIQYLDEHEEHGVDNSGLKCVPYTGEEYRWYCYTEDAVLRENLPQRVRDCMQACPTLRKMTLLWAHCVATHPNRVIHMNLDDLATSCDRLGEASDGYYTIDNLW